MNPKSLFRLFGGRENSEKAARQDDALIDTPSHSDAVEDADDDVLADERSARPTARFRRLQR